MARAAGAAYTCAESGSDPEGDGPGGGADLGAGFWGWTMMIERDSVHFRILERLCAMPKAVRGISGAMLERRFNDTSAVEELASAGLITGRGWADGPGAVWVPTAAGEALYQELTRRSS